MTKKIFFLCLAFFFISCSQDENKQKIDLNTSEEITQIEQNDETTELSDTNVPIPVQEDKDPLPIEKEIKNDRSSSYQQTSDDIAKLYAKECAFCHGKNGEKKALGASLIIKDMSKEEFANTLKGYQAGTYGKKLAKQMKPYADMLNAQQISQLATLIAKAD